MPSFNTEHEDVAVFRESSRIFARMLIFLSLMFFFFVLSCFFIVLVACFFFLSRFCVPREEGSWEGSGEEGVRGGEEGSWERGSM